MKGAELPQPRPGLEDGAAWHRAMVAGDFPAAWQVSDAVLAARSPAERDQPGVPYHLRWVWDGTPVDGADVLVRCYHGLGDTLQFCRFLPALRRRAAHVTMEVQPALLPLIDSLGAVDRLVAFDEAAPLPPAPCTLEIMELCHALRLAPQPAPYLPVLRRRGGGIGVCWQAGAGWRPQRSIPLAALRPVLPATAALQSLQPGAPADMAPCPDRLADTAALVAGLDLVVTVDTMIAHLAGAIGVPILLLLDAEPDWRWQAGGLASVWYRSVRKYRQASPGDWSAPLAALRRDLTERVAGGTVEE